MPTSIWSPRVPHRVGSLLVIALLAFALAPQHAHAQRTNSRAQDHKVSDDITRAVTLAYNRLSDREKQALATSLWQVWIALEDKSPAPYVDPTPPAEENACVDCGRYQAYPNDPCLAIRQQMQDLTDSILMLGVAIDAMQMLKQAFVDAEFYGGIAQLVADVVTTSISLATAGTGAVFSRAATKALAGIATSQIRQSMTSALVDALPEPFASYMDGTLTQAAVDQIANAFTQERKALSNQRFDLTKAFNACRDNYTATLRKINAANEEVWQCRQANQGRVCFNN